MRSGQYPFDSKDSGKIFQCPVDLQVQQNPKNICTVRKPSIAPLLFEDTCEKHSDVKPYELKNHGKAFRYLINLGAQTRCGKAFILP
ncbi:hypothetical protein GH733_019704 [Mirounga leonina]|nr:hypothetical protein GH733_019708 [Mirounga leonina]KAF3812323.1 hypothetical protein GH733_019704 [Mirounga leonina]